MIRELLLVHHSHTDIGFTHPQPAVFELHLRFIEAALDLAESTQEASDEARFRWTCEVTGMTRIWWDQATERDRGRFLAAVKRGQLEVAALQWHLTPLADLQMLVKSLDNVKFFRSLGIPIRAAMNTDVNGVPWGLVDVLLDHEIGGFSMSVNSHLGGPVSPRPGAFRWASPDGREILAWNGYQYWHAANGLMRIPTSVDVVAEALPKVLAETEARGYSLAYLPIQITNPSHPDNAGPDANLTPFIEAWNARGPEVRIRTILLSEIFDRLRKEELPLLSGDWTDYWNLGAGSSARETTVFMSGLCVLNAAHQVAAWPGPAQPREGQHMEAAHAHLALYAEHTWGADCSISAPDSIETRIQWATKSAFAFEGLGHARIVLRDALHRLAEGAGGDDPTLLLYNPLPMAVTVPMRLPINNLDWALTPGVHHRHRLDGVLSSLEEGSTKWCTVELPALGYRTYRVVNLPSAESSGLAATDGVLSSTRTKIEFLNDGGVRSLVVDDVEYVGSHPSLTFGVPVLERPSGGSRREIMKLDFTQIEPADGWQRDWPRITTPGRLVDHSSRFATGAVEYRQVFAMENGDHVGIVYRLFTDDPSVDMEVTLDSAGDSLPYSLALPFTLPDSGATQWHFDTAGAIVEFDREQLPDAARHYVTTRRFIRMQTESLALSIATPDVPLWKFGGMFFAPTSQLDPAERSPVALAWLANNYWEVNFLANQSGRTRYRLRLLPHVREAIDASYTRALPYAVSPRVHAYRQLGPIRSTTESLFELRGDGVSLESVTKIGSHTLLTILNLRDTVTMITISPGALEWIEAWQARMDGTPVTQLTGGRMALTPRGVHGVLLLT